MKRHSNNKYLDITELQVKSKKKANQVTFLSHENLKLHHGQDENLPIILT